MKRICVVFGTRPEVIKLAPVIAKLKKHPTFKVLTCALLQHSRMLREQLGTFGITPSHVFPMPFGDRGVMGRGNPLRRAWALLLVGWGFLSFVRMLRRERPDLLVVQGDTSTVLIASFIAFSMRVPVAHVEAGLRSGNKYAPFPEEINRQLVARLAELHFAPTPLARANLLREGIADSAIAVTGNTELDALRMITKERAVNDAKWEALFRDSYGIPFDADRKLVVVTAHRRESFGAGMERIAEAIARIAESRTDATIVFPLHLNRNVRGVMERKLKDIPNVFLIEPLAYEPFVFLLRRSYIILTDSGGIQEAVSMLGKPLVVLREVTERPEGVSAGNAVVVGTDADKIFSETERLFRDAAHYRAMAKTHDAYGDGHAAERIAGRIAAYLR
jgi:UDP-N-acetylglucosamine 2-epimerase (non-hydrolysing)